MNSKASLMGGGLDEALQHHEPGAKEIHERLDGFWRQVVGPIHKQPTQYDTKSCRDKNTRDNFRVTHLARVF